MQAITHNLLSLDKLRVNFQALIALGRLLPKGYEHAFSQCTLSNRYGCGLRLRARLGRSAIIPKYIPHQRIQKFRNLGGSLVDTQINTYDEL